MILELRRSKVYYRIGPHALPRRIVLVMTHQLISTCADTCTRFKYGAYIDNMNKIIVNIISLYHRVNKSCKDTVKEDFMI